MTTTYEKPHEPPGRDCYVAIPKNRGGRSDVHATMRYYPACGIFRSVPETPEAPAPERAKAGERKTEPAKSKNQKAEMPL